MVSGHCGRFGHVGHQRQRRQETAQFLLWSYKTSKTRTPLVDQGKFDQAVTYAITKGYFRDPSTPDPDKSSEEKGVILLRTSGSSIIAKVPVSALSGITPADIERVKTSAKTRKAAASGSQRDLAVAWAQSMGYPVPTKMGGCLATILVVVGLCIYIIPGVLLLIWIWVQANQYERDMNALVEKWVDAGRPNAGEGIKEVTRLERIVERVETPPASSASTEQRLEELNSMKEKGLITDEEYQAMREKALGL